MLKVGFVGWRGMVGSVLMERMNADKDFRGIESFFFSTSQAGAKAPALDGTTLGSPTLLDASDLAILSKLDAVVSCQGGDYTSDVHPRLRAAGWKGYWIDAASTLRMKKDAVIILDPVNRGVIDRALAAGVRDYIGGNCTVSLMLMGVAGLFREGLVEWLSSMTYQAASGAGAKNMRELVDQMRFVTDASKDLLDDPSSAILELDRRVTEAIRDPKNPTAAFGAPLAGSLIAWIDRAVEDGQTREEWKGCAETNKILGLEGSAEIPVDGLCVRVGAMRCHSQGLTIKLKKDVPLADLEAIIASSTLWTRLVPNDKASTLKDLTPAACSGTLDVPVGRIHKMKMGPQYLAAFTSGDQLLWGAAEPVKRMIGILREHLGK